jgi:hypothetical protein
MLDLKDIKKQLVRLSGLSFSPTTPEGWTELGKVLRRHCCTMEHVERVIDRWPETEANVPKPAQLASLASSIPADPAMDGPIWMALSCQIGASRAVLKVAGAQSKGWGWMCDFQQIMAKAPTLRFNWLRPTYGLFYPGQH